MFKPHYLVLISIIGGIFLQMTIASDDVNGNSKCHFDNRCHCKTLSEDSIKADCANLKLVEIPRFPNNILCMDLSHNLIKHIQDYAFENNTRLVKLDLSFNRLQTLGNHSFNGLCNLSTLLINDNNITEVDENTLFHLPKLQLINFKRNPFNSLNLNFKDAFALTTAKLDFLPNEGAVENRFSGLSNLTHLDLSGLTGKCKVKTLTNETFELLPLLESIDVSACHINYIFVGTFRHLAFLSLLDVSWNRCLKSTGVENITHDLPYTSIKDLKVNSVRQPFDLTIEITTANFEKLIYTNLTKLFAEGNKIQLFEKGALGMLPETLRYLSIGDNSFSYGDYLFDLYYLPIHFLNLSSLFKTHDPMVLRTELCDDHHEEGRNLNSIAKHTQLTSSGFHMPPHQEGYSLPPFKLPPNITTIIYKNCNLQYEIPPLLLSENKIQYIDASNNIFHSWMGPITHLDNLEYLDLSNNFCTNISKVFFLTCQNLRTLLLKNNILGFILPDDADGNILQHTKQLQKIDLSMNKIPTLPPKFFKHQNSLEELYMNNNMLEDVVFEIIHMKNLSYFDLSNNILPFLNDDVRKQLETVHISNKNFRVDISGNHLQCTCDTLDFLQWISTTDIVFNNLNKTNCQLKNKTTVSLLNANLLFTTLSIACSSYTSLIIASAMLFVFSSILICCVIYRHRWKIRYLYYVIKSRYRGTIKAPTNSSEIYYEYDAFVSYADEDSKFIHNPLISNLEKETGFKLCIHERDFIPGNDIASNITSAVHNSRKTVVVMSQNYRESYWCMFEYNMARMESIYARNKENIIFLIFLEQIQPSKLPLHVLELVQSQSYIEYPDDPYGNTVFWDELRQALS